MIRIGCGAGLAGDWIDPAVDLAERGALDYLAFGLAERTLAYGHLARMADSEKGYDPRIERRLGAVLAACVKHGTTIVSNMGAANPRAAGRLTVELAKRMGLRIRVAVVQGDDLLRTVTPPRRCRSSARPSRSTAYVWSAPPPRADHAVPPGAAARRDLLRRGRSRRRSGPAAVRQRRVRRLP